MRALTVRQPWAAAIAHRGKRTENRGWKLPALAIGERILIHAAAAADRAATIERDDSWPNTRQLGRRYLGIDINPDYHQLATARFTQGVLDVEVTS